MGQYETPKAGVDVPDLTADGDVRAALDKQKNEAGSGAHGRQPGDTGIRHEAGGNCFVLHYGQNDVQTTAILKGDEFTSI